MMSDVTDTREGVELGADDATWLPERLATHGIALLAASLWKWRQTPGALAAYLGRYGAHLAIAALAVAIGLVRPLALTVDARTNPSAPIAAPAEPEPAATTPAAAYGSFQATSERAIVRRANPQTTIPERVRLEALTYTVQEGDTVFGIAVQFGLAPTTIVWSNWEVLQGAPWLLQPGLPLLIPPVDGAYHTVRAGESIQGIAEAYEVTTEALLNVWNPIAAGQVLTEGLMLMVPGGVGGEFDWEPPPPPTPVPAPTAVAGSPSAGTSQPTASASLAPQPGAVGSFILPTGSYEVSGWVFGDPRNPTHIGLDYRCRLGNPIYASDAGVVVFAGWGGGYGNLVRVDHGNGFVTYYAHFNAFAVGYGQAVSQGQVLGYCGTTGYSSGPHLHYEVRLNGVPQNPAFYQP
jgi:murein DD-endopeptidase MepM/ murein hydrolase activator NlpD